MKKFFKYSFYAYVICLAAYVTYNTLLHKRFGTQEVEFQRSQRSCHDGGAGWKYCIHTNDRTSGSSYLYVFHSQDEDERFWSKGGGYPALLQKYWQEKSSKIPKVITISFGPLWLIAPKMTNENTGLLERFRDEVFNKIEGHLGRPKRRFLLGESMGGLNVLSLALHLPQYFSRVASLCPPIYIMTMHKN